MSTARTSSRSLWQLAFAVLCFSLLCRLLLCERTDLIDPTEARYATVAAQMVQSGNWLTPKLPMPEGVVPYMSKPPLHYWLTAVSYSLFGIEEWSARLPSFVAACIMVLLVYRFAKLHFGAEQGLMAGLIMVSTAVFYFLAGASVIDVSLSALVTLALFSAYRFFSNPDKHRRSIYVSALACGLAFLCKGPFGLVVTGLPIGLWSLARRDFSWMKRVPWVSCVAILIVVTVPWFLLNEQAAPGSIKYFFWNENFSRYFFSNSGDLYGDGHRHWLGTSWVFLFLLFAPWAVVPLFALWRTGFRSSWAWAKAHDARLFLSCCALGAPLFLTFSRHVHILYLLSTLPALSILTAVLLKEWEGRGDSPVVNRKRWFESSGILLAGIIVLWVGIAAAGLILEFSAFSIVIALAVVILFPIILSRLSSFRSALSRTAFAAGASVGCYVLVIGTLSPYVSERRSAEKLIEKVADSAVLGHRVPRIAVSTHNSFSPYWTALAWREELRRKVEIVYVDSSAVAATNICHVLVKTKAEDVRPELQERFRLLERSGDWQLLRRKDRRCEEKGDSVP